MAVTNFNGTNEEIRAPLPASGGGILSGAVTVAVLSKRNRTGAFYEALMAGVNSAGVYQWEFAWDGESSINEQDSLSFYVAANSGYATSARNGTGTKITSTTTWYVLAFTKASGTAAGRFHFFPLGGAWSHVAAGISGTAAVHPGDPATTASGHLDWGEAQDADDLSGRLAVSGLWTSELSDAQVEALATNLRTSDWVNHAVAPAGVWEFNRALATSDLVDLTANAQTATGTVASTTDNSGIQGTSIVTTDDPPSWNFNGAGGGGVTVKQLAALGVG